MPDKSYSL